MNGAGEGRALDHHFLVVRVVAVRHVEDHLDLGDAARVGAHGLGDLDGRARHVHVVRAAVDADDGHGAGGERRGAEVRGREGLALALVVHRGIRDKRGAARHMDAFGAQVPKIFGGDGGH